jgi:Flp pilus assembly protein TadD
MTARTRMSFTVVLLSLITLSLGGCQAARPIDTIRASGDHMFRFGDYEGARDEYAEIVSRQPGDWEAHYKLGVCLLHTGDFAAARRSLEVAHTRKPDNQDVANALAEAMFRQNDEARLFAFLRERASRTQQVVAYQQLGRYSMELNDPDSARVAIDTAIEIDKGRTTDPYLDAATLAERLGQLDEAVRRLRQALGIDTRDYRVRERLRALGEDPDTLMPLPPGR